MRTIGLVHLLSLVLATTASPAKSRASTLKAAAKPRYFAAAIGAGHITNASDAHFPRIAAAYYDGLTPENEMKWEVTEPEQGVFNFSSAETVWRFGAELGYTIRGHTLVWYSQLAPWVATLVGSELTEAMKTHITVEMEHFKGR